MKKYWPDSIRIFYKFHGKIVHVVGIDGLQLVSKKSLLSNII
jgi:hypothetical protein